MEHAIIFPSKTSSEKTGALLSLSEEPAKLRITFHLYASCNFSAKPRQANNTEKVTSA